MNDLFELVSAFVQPVALILALVLMVSILQRKERAPINSALLMGALFSFAIIMSMSDPIDLGEGGIHDLRGLLIGASTALLGPVVGMMAMIAGLVMRLSIGGPGMIAGCSAMLLAFCGGLLWRHIVMGKKLETWKKSTLMGLMISIHLLALFLLPKFLWPELFLKIAPFYVIANVVGATLFNYLIGGELSFLSAAETSKIEANTDHMTGLLNRRGLDLVIPDLKIPNAANKGRALLYFDVDRFKSTNDTFGHLVGDQVLKDVVDRIAGNLRQHDVFARLGGDEFAVILPDVDVKEAKQIADRCRAVVADEAFTLGHEELPITISLGAIWLHQPTELERMLHAADTALYKAKTNGRNSVVFLSSLRGLKAKPALQPTAAVA